MHFVTMIDTVLILCHEKTIKIYLQKFITNIGTINIKLFIILLINLFTPKYHFSKAKDFNIESFNVDNSLVGVYSAAKIALAIAIVS